MNMCKPLLLFLAILTLLANTTLNAQDCVPVLVSDSDNSLCEGDELNLTVSVTLAAGCDIGGYEFNGNGTPGGFIDDAQITVNNASGDYSVTVSIIDNDDDSITCPCVGNETSNEISINPTPPTPTVDILDDEVCAGDNIQLFFSGEDLPGNTYNWTGPNGYTSNAQNPLISNVTTENSGAYNLTIISQEACVSPESADETVTVNELPDVPDADDVTVCPSFPATLAASGEGTIRWYDSPVGGELLFEGESYDTPPLTQTTIFYVEVLDEDTDCVSPRIAVTAEVVPPIPSPIAQDTVICEGDAAVLSAIGTGTPGNFIRWYDEPFFGTPLQENLMPPATQTYTTPFGLLENDIFYVAEFDVATGCESPRTAIRVIVEPEVPEPVGQDGEVCAGGTITLTAEHGGEGNTTGEFYWFTDPIAGELLNIGQNFTPSPNLLAEPGIVNFYVEERFNGCISPTRDQITITILENPDAPVVPPVTICNGESATLVATGSATINWYSDPDASNLLFTGANFLTPLLSQNTTFYVQQAIAETECVSPIVPVTVEVLSVPGDPNAGDLEICNNENAILTVSGSGAANSVLNVYENITDESPIASAPMPPAETTFDLGQLGAGSFTFYIEELNTLTSCASNRVPISVTVAPAPAAPTAADVFVCQEETAVLTATGSGSPNSVINWYSDEALTNFIGSGTSIEVTPDITTLFYATEVNDICESAATEVIVTVNPLPPNPQVVDFQVCIGESIELSATGSGGIFSWFEDANGTNLVNIGPTYTTPALTQNTTFYVSETTLATGCTSELVPVNVTVIDAPFPPAVTDISVCTNETAVITAIGSGNGTINWYANVNDTEAIQSNEMPPAVATFSIDGAAFPLGANTFFVEEDNGTCSSERVPATVTVLQAPAPPLTQAPTAVCAGESAQIIAFSSGSTAGTFNFYDETGTNLLFTGTTFNTPPLSVGTTFQVREVAGECESEGTAVFIDVSPLPAPPQVTPLTICEGETAELTVEGSGGQFTWFDDPSATNVIATGPTYTTDPLTQTTTFYVREETPGTGCQSVIVPLTVSVLPTPPTPSSADLEICANQSGNIIASGSGTGSLLWFDSPDLDAIPLQIDTMPPANAIFVVSGLPVGTTQFYVAETDGTCTSDRTPVTVTVLAVPSPPVIQAPPSVCEGETATINASASGASSGPFNFYDETGTNLLFTGTSFITPPLTVGTTFQITEINGECESEGTTIFIDVNPLPAAPQVTPVSVCEGETATLNVEGSGGVFTWFDDPTGNNELVVSPEYTTDPLTQTTTFYVQELNPETGCVSEIVPLTVTVTPTPSTPSAEDIEICANEMGEIVAAGSGTGSLLWFDSADPDADPIQTDVMPPANASLTVSGLPVGTTLFYVAETDGTCTSDLTAVTVTVLEVPDIPTIEVPVAICEETSATLIANSNSDETGTFNWYDATGVELLFTGTVYTTPVLSATTTFLVTEVLNGCESDTATAVVTVNPLPANPVVTPLSICEGETATLTAEGSGGIFSWFTDPNGNNQVATGPEYTTDPLTQSTTFYVQEQNPETGCVSDIIPLTVSVLPTPPTPSAEDIEICANEVGEIIASGSGTGSLLWFDSADPEADPIQTDEMPPANASLTVSDLPVGTTLFYVAETDGTCTSDRTAVTVNVLEVPAAPIVDAPASICEGETALLVASSSGDTNGPFNFYNETGTNLLFTGTSFTTPELLIGTTYQVTEIVGDCESEATIVFIGVDPLPAPSQVTPIDICEGESATLTAEGSGGIFSWFDDPNGNNQVATGPEYTTDPLTQTTTFYVQEQNDETGCLSPIVPLTVTVLPTPPTPSAEDIEICVNEVGEIVAAGSGTGSLLWFNTPDLDADPIQVDEMPPSNATLIVSDLPEGTNTFFVAESNGSCISDRTAVTVTVLEVPDIPLVLVPLAICEGETATLTATNNGEGSGIFNWYNETGEELLFSGSVFTTPPLAITTTYLVTQIIGGCESDTATAVVNVNELPSPPIAPPINICEGEEAILNGIPSSVGNLLDWFVDASATEAIFTGEIYNAGVLTQTTTFFVRERDPATNCTSELLPVLVTVIPAPETPEASDVTVCVGEITQLIAAGSGNGSILWYDQATGGTPLEIDTMSQAVASFEIGPFTSAGTFLFYVEEQSTEDCFSPRAPITVTVKPIPVAPLAEDASICAGTSTVLTATSGGDTDGIFEWLDASATTLLFTGAAYTTPELDTTTAFTVREVLDGCVGPTETVTVSVNPIPEAIVVPPDTVCEGETATLEVEVPENIVVNWYSDPSGTNLLNIGPTFTSAILTQSTTFWVQTLISGTGCVSELVPVDVIVLPLPTPPSSSNINICANETGEILASGSGTGNILWYEEAEGGLPIQINPMPPANATLNVGPLPPGVYVFYVEESNGICSSSRTPVTVTVQETPTAPAAVGAIICAGNSVILTASSTSNTEGEFRWFDETGSDLLFTGAVFTTGILDTTTSYLVREVLEGCESPTTLVTVTVDSLPASPIVTPLDICEGETAVLTAEGIEGAVLNWYADPNGSNLLSTGPTFETPPLNQTTTYWVQQLTLASGCLSELVPLVVSVIPAPEAPSATEIVVCETDTGVIIGSGSGTLGSLLRWYDTSIGGIALQVDTLGPATSARFTVGPFAPGTYTFYVEEVNPTGCVSPRTAVEVVVPPKPAEPSVNDVTICGGSSVTITAPGTGIFNWYDASEGGNLLTTGLAYTTPILDSTTSIFVTQEIDGCESDREEVVITVIPLPDAPIISSNSPLCAGDTLLLFGPDLPAGFAYSWTGPNGFMSSEQNPVIFNVNEADNQGTYSLAISESVNGCTSGETSIIVEISPVPQTPSITSNSPVCGGERLTLTASEISGVSAYRWITPTGDTIITNIPILEFAAATDSLSGIFSLSVVANGCPSPSAFIEVQVIGLSSVPEVTSNSPVCEGDDLMLFATSVPGAVYNWTGPDGFTSNLQNPVVEDATFINSGTYEATITVNGCPTTAPGSAFVDVVPGPILAGISSNSPVCQGDTLILTAPMVENASYFWVGPGGFTSTAQNPIIPNVIETDNQGNYELTVTDTITGCSSTADTEVFIDNGTGLVVIASSNAPVCEGDFIQLNVSVSPSSNNFTFQWSGPNGFSSSEQNPQILEASLDQAGDYSVLVNGSAGCLSGSENRTIVEVTPGPEINAGPDQTVLQGEDVQLSVTGASVYNWEPASFLDNPGIPNPTANLPLGTTTFIVTGLDLNGCESIDSVSIIVEPNTENIGIMDLFTPNGDGVNDTWMIEFIDNVGTHSLVVFNRGGVEVFSTDNYQNDWDGTYRGRPLPEGTYWYVLRAEEQEFKGAITIIR